MRIAKFQTKLLALFTVHTAAVTKISLQKKKWLQLLLGYLGSGNLFELELKILDNVGMLRQLKMVIRKLDAQ